LTIKKFVAVILSLPTKKKLVNKTGVTTHNLAAFDKKNELRVSYVTVTRKFDSEANNSQNEDDSAKILAWQIAVGIQTHPHLGPGHATAKPRQ
jgi:hypothetical protein